MYTLENHRAATEEARMNLLYAHGCLADMARAGNITGDLFRKRQDYLARCIREWREVTEQGMTILKSYWS